MICENTISAGFYFIFGKFLFDTLMGVLIIAVVIGVHAYLQRPKK